MDRNLSQNRLWYFGAKPLMWRVQQIKANSLRVGFLGHKPCSSFLLLRDHLRQGFLQVTLAISFQVSFFISPSLYFSCSALRNSVPSPLGRVCNALFVLVAVDVYLMTYSPQMYPLLAVIRLPCCLGFLLIYICLHTSVLCVCVYLSLVV